MTEQTRPDPGARSTPAQPPEPAPATDAGIPRAVVVSAIVLAIGLGVLIGSKLRKPAEVREVAGPERVVTVRVPCTDCEHTRDAIAAAADRLPPAEKEPVQ